MSFSRKKIVYVNIDTMQEHLDYCYNYKKIIIGKKPEGTTFKMNAYVEDGMVNFQLTYKRGSQVTTYICRKDGEDQNQWTDGGEAYRILSMYYDVPDLRENEQLKKDLDYNEDDKKFEVSASALMYKNDKYENTNIEYAIGYDLNSSYSYAMLKPMPNTSVRPKIWCLAKKGFIGFNEKVITEHGCTKRELVVVQEGKMAHWMFPIMESPFEKFVKHWYNKKKNAKTKEEKGKAKGILNYSVGYLQKVNPFLRATILYYANQEIKKLMDDNTLYCNTDSIVSLVKKDLKVGSEIGEFKIEHEGRFAFVGFNYQWNYDKPSYRRVPKTWFKEGWDILKDPIPNGGNVVRFNRETYKLEDINYEISKNK